MIVKSLKGLWKEWDEKVKLEVEGAGLFPETQEVTGQTMEVPECGFIIEDPELEEE